MKSTAELIKQGISSAPELSVLAIAHEFPEFLVEHRGPIVYFGTQSPRPELNCRELLYRRAHTAGELVQAFVSLRTAAPAPRFDLVIIDHHHALEALVAQINAATDFTHPATVFVFDDAVPPDLGMSGPEPTQDWWVGEVWMLAELLPALTKAKNSKH